MAQWLVTQGDRQFAVDGMARLRTMARGGQLHGGDMIQPPGTSEWMYVSEVPELKNLVGDVQADGGTKGGGSAVAMGVVAVVAVGVLVAGGAAAFFYTSQLAAEQGGLIGDKGLAYTEMLVTNEGAALTTEAGGGSMVAAVAKDSTLDLLAKRGTFYKGRSKQGAEGWIATNQVIPMYQYGGAEVRDEFDPLYNPDRYLDVANASWTQLPDKEQGQVTVFKLMLSNASRYDMADVVLVATIKDAKGHELEKLEIAIEGVVPGNGSALVGTLAPDPKADEADAKNRLLTDATFAEMASENPDLQLRFSDGVEVKVATQDFVTAELDVAELRAVPK